MNDYLRKICESALKARGLHPNDIIDQASARGRFDRAVTPLVVLDLIEDRDALLGEIKELREALDVANTRELGLLEEMLIGNEAGKLEREVERLKGQLPDEPIGEVTLVQSQEWFDEEIERYLALNYAIKVVDENGEFRYGIV